MADKVDKPKKQKAKSKQGDKGVLAALPSTRPERIGARRGAAPAARATGNAKPAVGKAAATKPAATARSTNSAKPAAKPRASATAKPAAASRSRAAAKPRASAAKPRATAARRKAAAPRTFEPTQAAEAAATPKAAAKPRATARPKPRATATRRKAAAPRTFEPTQAAEVAAGAADERAAGAIPLRETPPRREDSTYPRPRPVREGAPGIGTGYRDQAASESGRPSGVELAATAVRAAGEVAQLGVTISGELLKGVVKRLPRP